MASMAVSSSPGPGHVVVVLRGGLGVTDAMRFMGALSVAATSGSRVIVDLAGLAYMDCSGLSALVSASRQARSVGGDLALAAPRQPVARLLSLTGVTGLLPVYASVAEAANGGGRAPAPAVLSKQTARSTRRTVQHHRRGHGTWSWALRMNRDGHDNRSGHLIDWLTAAAPGVVVRLGLLPRPDLPLEPFGPAGPSVVSTTMAI